MNKRNATPNSAMGAICPTSVMETAESQDTFLGEGTQAERAEDNAGGQESEDRAQFQSPEKRYDHACRGQKQQQFLVIFRSRSCHQLRPVAVRSAPAVLGHLPQEHYAA
jgi:hypothetical protein